MSSFVSLVCKYIKVYDKIIKSVPFMTNADRDIDRPIWLQLWVVHSEYLDIFVAPPGGRHSQ